jgi:prepilin-type N-terminal cleavage/methylation domain-containing protein
MHRTFLTNSKKNLSTRGFTLIELLVVIAIIGVLSAVVLAALNTARTKGTDASSKANLDTIRTQSVLYFDTNGNYGTNVAAASTCSTAGTFFVLDSNTTKALAAITNSGVTPVCNQLSNGGAWLIYTPAKTAGVNGWCVDSNNTSKSEPTTVTANGTTVACP